MPDVTEITTTQNWTVPSGINFLNVYVVAQGAVGGDANAALEQGGAGGGGGGSRWMMGYPVQPGWTFSISFDGGSVIFSRGSELLSASRGANATYSTPGSGGGQSQNGFSGYGAGQNGATGGNSGTNGGNGGNSGRGSGSGAGGTPTVAASVGSSGGGGGGQGLNGPGSGAAGGLGFVRIEASTILNG